MAHTSPWGRFHSLDVVEGTPNAISKLGHGVNMK